MIVLILGGTQEAAELAKEAVNLPNIEVKVSLAGRTSQAIASNNSRIGGFGGVAGLTQYLKAEKIDLLIDATHPFAAKISENAAIAAEKLELPRLMLVRPQWEAVKDDEWIEVETIQAAAGILPSLAERVFLTIGRQELTAFAQIENIWFLMRAIEKPSPHIILPKGLLLLDRGPFDRDLEKQLLHKYNIDTVVSKNSGGNATYAKIIAARELGIKVIMVKRPILPQGECVEDVEAALKWVRGLVIGNW
ncbi:cobalt-precorrin-6A reductase [Rivularia sp. UHCC 0363]|uniref:cobalt-precorrin-6A reductase n=1 Tax=Rivularia sp. UHCC 0363 TaxID=3110244 RepID=UPI002B20D986|nr:cobalt-precorrin-6A reductase [Rivularia sp. UHCC 0363]MEA5592762.1 cobalt-precorrin-6A reductase [Rivularia sp. UHCC 0363]